jgi:hypothetical protein
MFSIVIGCMTSAPDGSIPRGYIRKFFKYRLKYTVFSSSQLYHSFSNFVGCTPSAPDGSSPLGYKRVLAACYRLKYFFFTTYFFLNGDEPLLLFLYIFPLFPLSVGRNTKARNLIGLLVCKGPQKVPYK